METYSTFSTTADVGIRIGGKGLEGLFRSALNGLNLLYFNQLLSKNSTLDSPVEHHLYQFNGDSPENLLVNLLSEVVFLLQNKERVTVSFSIVHLDATHIKINLHTIALHKKPELEIKSVTYHNLEIKEDEEGILSAEVIFDI